MDVVSTVNIHQPAVLVVDPHDEIVRFPASLFMGLTHKYYIETSETKRQVKWLLENYQSCLQCMNELMVQADMDWVRMQHIHDRARERIQFDKLSPFERVIDRRSKLMNRLLLIILILKYWECLLWIFYFQIYQLTQIIASLDCYKSSRYDSGLNSHIGVERKN